MLFGGKTLSQLTEDDLQALVQDSVRDGDTIEFLWLLGLVCTLTALALEVLLRLGEERLTRWSRAVGDWSLTVGTVGTTFGDIVESVVLPHRSRLRNLISERLQAAASPDERRQLALLRLALWAGAPFIMISGASLWFVFWLTNRLAEEGQLVFMPLLVSPYLLIWLGVILVHLAERLVDASNPLVTISGRALGAIALLLALLLVLPMLAVSFPAIVIFAAYVALWVIARAVNLLTKWLERIGLTTAFFVLRIALGATGILALAFATRS